MVEVNCETDFVARNEQFKELINEIAMQIAASDPKYIDASMIPPELIESVKQSFLREIEESCKNVEDKEKLLEEKLKMYLSEVSLYDQPFIKDPSITIRELIQSAIAKFGENITVSRFVRYKLGELK
jgi:elongation factor Ts